MNEELKYRELDDDALDSVSGGVYMRGSTSSGSVDVNQNGCAVYQCKVCGGAKGAHTADCTAGRPDCCGSCVHGDKSSGDLICTVAADPAGK